MARLFGTDGIRGTANEHPITADMALKIGRAAARLFRGKGRGPKIVIGKDTRLSGYMLEGALTAGICSHGGDVILAGVLPTPGVAFLTKSMRADAGIVISASHNPYSDNGIKFFGSDGLKLSDEKERDLEGFIEAEVSPALNGRPCEPGRAFRLEDGRGRYIAFLKGTFPAGETLEGFAFVLDCANGAAYRAAPETFLELGAEVTPLFAEPNGRNINLNCGSLHPETLANEVVRRGAQAGFAFDGDGDRLIAVDERGQVLTGDRILAVCAARMKEEGALAGNVVVRTVMSNHGLTVALSSLGIDSVFTDVGDRFVLEEMLSRGAVLGGEDSGHVIFLAHHTTGDGIITALQLAAVMKKTGRPLSELASIMNVYPQVLINVEVKRRLPIEAVPEIRAAIAEAEAALAGRGRVLVRYSGTQDLCRVMVEGPTREETERLARQIAAAAERCLND